MTAREICERCGIAKVSTLFILKKLYTDGIVERQQQDNTFVFSARAPEVLGQRLSTAREAIGRQQDHLQNAINELQSMQDYETNRKIQYYNDLEHIRRLRSGLLDTQLLVKNSRNGVEYFENAEYIYLISLAKRFAIKVAPKGDFLKLLELCKSYS